MQDRGSLWVCPQLPAPLTRQTCKLEQWQREGHVFHPCWTLRIHQPSRLLKRTLFCSCLLVRLQSSQGFSKPLLARFLQLGPFKNPTPDVSAFALYLQTEIPCLLSLIEALQGSASGQLPATCVLIGAGASLLFSYCYVQPEVSWFSSVVLRRRGCSLA